MDWRSEHKQSIGDPVNFWAEQAKNLAWLEPPKTTLRQNEDGSTSWFPDGTLNTAHLCLDAHIEAGRGQSIAYHYDSPVTGTKRSITYLELWYETAKVAGALREMGVGKGDRVIIYMPMIPEAVIAMLACARLGAIHAVVFGGFAAHELAIRIDGTKPKVVLAASCGIEGKRIVPYKPALDRAIELAEHKPEHCVILQRPQSPGEMVPLRDVEWSGWIEQARPETYAPVSSLDPLYVLYTSGTSGTPKGVVRESGGHAVALLYALRTVYGMKVGDVFWVASDVGWCMGHSFMIYGPLIGGCTAILYEGKPVGTPNAGAFWRVLEEYGVNALMCAPSAFRAIRKADPEADLLEKYDLSKLRTIFLAGEKLDTTTYDWLGTLLQIPIVDHWWQTETGWPISAVPCGLAELSPKRGSAGVSLAGYDLQILNEQGEQVESGQTGNIAIKLPLPPGSTQTLWAGMDKFQESYLSRFDGYYHTGDAGYIDQDGFLFIGGRTDDIINVAGHRLSTGEMEDVIARHPAIAENVVVGVPEPLRGQVPAGLIVLKDNQYVSQEEIEAELVKSIRDEIGAIASFKRAIIVKQLPKNQSGKVMRKLLRWAAEGEDFRMPANIEDVHSVQEIIRSLKDYRESLV